jgi:hypothetical protein
MGIFSTRLSENILILEKEVLAERYPWARKREMTPEHPIRIRMAAIKTV